MVTNSQECPECGKSVSVREGKPFNVDMYMFRCQWCGNRYAAHNKYERRENHWAKRKK